MEEICELRNTNGDAFGPGMATTLFRLKARKDRRWLLRLWEKGSSARDLKTKVKEKLGTVANVKGGRKATQPTSQSDAIRQIRDRCANWLGWYELLADEKEGDVSVGKLPAPIQKSIASNDESGEEVAGFGDPGRVTALTKPAVVAMVRRTGKRRGHLGR